MPIHSAALENLRMQAVTAGLLVKFATDGVLVIAAPDEAPVPASTVLEVPPISPEAKSP